MQNAGSSVESVSQMFMNKQRALHSSVYFLSPFQVQLQKRPVSGLGMWAFYKGKADTDTSTPLLIPEREFSRHSSPGTAQNMSRTSHPLVTIYFGTQKHLTLCELWEPSTAHGCATPCQTRHRAWLVPAAKMVVPCLRDSLGKAEAEGGCEDWPQPPAQRRSREWGLGRTGFSCQLCFLPCNSISAGNKSDYFSPSSVCFAHDGSGKGISLSQPMSMSHLIFSPSYRRGAVRGWPPSINPPQTVESKPGFLMFSKLNYSLEKYFNIYLIEYQNFCHETETEANSMALISYHDKNEY